MRNRRLRLEGRIGRTVAVAFALLFDAACTSTAAPATGSVSQTDLADGSVPATSHEYAVFTSVTSMPAPAARTFTNLVYDAGRGVSILYGGATLQDVVGDTWEYDGKWTQVSADGDNDAPGARSSAAMAYAAGRGVAVLFGGYRSPSALCETWEWNGAKATWRLASQPACTDGEGLTARRVGLAMTDLGNDVVLFGGNVQGASGFVRSNALLRWDGTAWSLLCDAECQSGSAALPAPRSNASLVHVHQGSRDVLWLFGGMTDAGAVNDTWQFEPSTARWTELCASAACRASAPSARAGQGAAFDSIRGRVVVHGGCATVDCATAAFGDLYEYDLANDAWAKGPPSKNASFPDAKGDFVATFDVKRGRVVEFGGFASAAFVGRTVEYSTRGAACASGATCDTASCAKAVATDATGTCAETCTGSADVPPGDFCAGGFRCSEACDAPCQTCAAVPGVCTAITSGLDDEPGDAPASHCSGAKACVAAQAQAPGGEAGVCLLVAGQTCSGPADCGSGNCARYGSAVCATANCGDKPCRPSSADGTCSVVGAGRFVADCMGIACGAAGDCLAACASDDDCDPDYYCDGDATHACKRGKRYGGACKSSQECGKGVCFDGVCCDQACGDSCQACGKDGRCKTLPAGSVPLAGHTDCVGASTGTCGGYCDGVAAQCTYPDGKSCGTGACVEDDWRESSICVHGDCVAGDAPSSCGAYSCTSGKCNTGCSSNDQCRRGAVCDKSSGAGVCNDQGTSCSADGAGVKTASGTIVSCAGYLCDSGACAFRPCTTATDCAAGYGCTEDHRCADQGAAGTGKDAGTSPRRDGGKPSTPAPDGGVANGDSGSSGVPAPASSCAVAPLGLRGSGSFVGFGVAVALLFRRRRTAPSARARRSRSAA